MEEQRTRRCARCHTEKLLSEFGRKRPRDYQPYCRPCQAGYKQEHYAKNKARYVRQSRERKQAVLAEVRNLKERGCSDCGVKYPHYVMDFDYREGEFKVGHITALIVTKGYTLDRILEEIAKCDVVCANCHRERTHQRRLHNRNKGLEQDRCSLL
jgi:hypothetical protein